MKNRADENNNRKIVFFDIDDTIFTPKLGITDCTKLAIRKLKENGHIPVVCTGRARSMVFPSIINVGFDGVIAGGGTYIEYDNKPLFRRDLHKETVKNLIEDMRKSGFIPVLEGHDYLYFENREKTQWNKAYNDVFTKYIKEIGSVIKEIPDDLKVNVAKVSGAFTDKSDLEYIKEKYEKEFSIVNHRNLLIELIPAGFSKAEGIKKIIDLLNIPWENTYAFGDSMNDYEMLTYVRYGVAMGNSDKRILEIAKYKTDTIENEGVYKGLKDLSLI